MAKDEHEDPPLQSVAELTLAKNEGPVIATHRKRGFLTDVNLTAASHLLHPRPGPGRGAETGKKRWEQPLRLDGKTTLTVLSDRLRAILDAKGLPTDKHPVMPIELDYAYDPEEHGIVADEDIWIAVAEDSTEPLTKDRIAAELLHTTKRLLRNCSDGQLRDVFRAMKLYQLYSLVGEINELAIAGKVSRKAREKGPLVRREKARNLKKQILAFAEKFWEDNPRLVGQPVNTAKKITKAFNEMRAVQEPGCKPLASKTIADHLRTALRPD